MVTWHLTRKLFPAKCHERATLRKLWRQTGNSSLSPAKCWPLLHVIAGISARFSNFAFVLFWYITNHLMTVPLGKSEFCFPRIRYCFPRLRLGKHWDSGNKIHCSPRDESLSVNCDMWTNFNDRHRWKHSILQRVELCPSHWEPCDWCDLTYQKLTIPLDSTFISLVYRLS